MIKMRSRKIEGKESKKINEEFLKLKNRKKKKDKKKMKKEVEKENKRG